MLRRGIARLALMGVLASAHYPGERGMYYLRQTEGNGWHQVHWSGSTIHHEGQGQLPACPH